MKHGVHLRGEEQTVTSSQVDDVRTEEDKKKKKMHFSSNISDFSRHGMKHHLLKRYPSTSHFLSDSALLMLLRFCSTVLFGGLFFFGCLAVTSGSVTSPALPSSLAPWAEGMEKRREALCFIPRYSKTT